MINRGFESKGVPFQHFKQTVLSQPSWCQHLAQGGLWTRALGPAASVFMELRKRDQSLPSPLSIIISSPSTPSMPPSLIHQRSTHLLKLPPTLLPSTHPLKHPHHHLLQTRPIYHLHRHCLHLHHHLQRPSYQRYLCLIVILNIFISSS